MILLKTTEHVPSSKQSPGKSMSWRHLSSQQPCHQHQEQESWSVRARHWYYYCYRVIYYYLFFKIYQHRIVRWHVKNMVPFKPM